jgi:hypothetical protein
MHGTFVLAARLQAYTGIALPSKIFYFVMRTWPHCELVSAIVLIREIRWIVQLFVRCCVGRVVAAADIFFCWNRERE